MITKNKNNHNVFNLEYYDNNIVAIKVKELSNLEIAKTPYISKEYDYISVTRGKNHILTVVKKDGSTFNFSWGVNGHTLIGYALEFLKKNVIDYIEEYCYIPLEMDFGSKDIANIEVCYNRYFECYQANFTSKKGKVAHAFIKACTCLDDINNYVNKVKHL